MSGFRVWGLGLSVLFLVFKFPGLGFRVHGLGFMVSIPGHQDTEDGRLQSAGEYMD